MAKIQKQLVQGVKDAAGIVVGKAAARMVPQTLNLPKQGALGLAVQAAVAVVSGMAASRFLGRDVGRMVLAGGITAPMETAAVAYNIPVLGPALAPTTSSAAVGRLRGYVQPRLSGYVQPTGARAAGMGGYVQPNGVADASGYDHAAY